jgi:hypothetical protein
VQGRNLCQGPKFKNYLCSILVFFWTAKMTCPVFFRLALLVTTILLSIQQGAAQTAPVSSPGPSSSAGVQVNFQLPTDGPLRKTYRVTLAPQVWLALSPPKIRASSL